jgi:hypothetical protein
MTSFYESVSTNVEHVATLLDVEDDVRILLAEPYRQVDVQVPIHADDGCRASGRSTPTAWPGLSTLNGSRCHL